MHLQCSVARWPGWVLIGLNGEAAFALSTKLCNTNHSPQCALCCAIQTRLLFPSHCNTLSTVLLSHFRCTVQYNLDCTYLCKQCKTQWKTLCNIIQSGRQGAIGTGSSSSTFSGFSHCPKRLPALDPEYSEELTMTMKMKTKMMIEVLSDRIIWSLLAPLYERCSSDVDGLWSPNPSIQSHI